jgi:hypothetical protein
VTSVITIQQRRPSLARLTLVVSLMRDSTATLMRLTRCVAVAVSCALRDAGAPISRASRVHVLWEGCLLVGFVLCCVLIVVEVWM